MDVERTIEFILEQQARFSTQQDRFAEQQALLTKQVDVIAKATHVLIQSQQEVRDAINEDRQVMRELREDIRQVNDNVGALVKVVDELVRRGNGPSMSLFSCNEGYPLRRAAHKPTKPVASKRRLPGSGVPIAVPSTSRINSRFVLSQSRAQ